VTRAESAGQTAGKEEPELPAKLATVLDHLEEVATAHDGELADGLSRITPLPADEDEPPAQAALGIDGDPG
jgi:hypothetical protein